MKFYQGELSGLYEFSSAVAENPFGATVLRIAEDCYDNVDKAVVDITEHLQQNGFETSVDEVIDLLTGDMVPTQEVVDELSEMWVTLDEEGNVDEEASARNADSLYQSAELSAQLALAELEAEEEGVEDEEYEDEDEDETEAEYEDEDENETLEVAFDPETEAAFSAYFAQQDEMSTRMAATDMLSDMRDQAQDLVSRRHMTPYMFSMLFSNRAKDDYINFSAAVEENGYTPEEYLMCMDFALNLFEDLGPIPGSEYQFSASIPQEISDGPIQFSREDEIDEEEARDLLNLLRGETK
jgi:hypothetical protein